MKKLLSIILALTLCFAAFSVFAPTAHAAGETISEEEAKGLIVKAYEFCRNVRAGASHIHENSQEYRIEVIFGEHPSERKYYWLAKEENLPGGSYEKMCEYAETIYTVEAAPEAYAYQLTGLVHPTDEMWEDLRPLFYRDENGILYSASGVVMSYNGAYLYPNEDNVEIEIVSGDSKTAKANVSVYFHYIDGPRTDDFDIVECRFENTANGWRIADSEFSLIMATDHAYLKDYRAKNPDAPNPSGGKLLLPDAKEMIYGVVGEYLFIYNYLAEVKAELSDSSSKAKYDTIFKEVTLPDGSVRRMEYVRKGDLNYSFSKNNCLEYCTKQVMEKLYSKVYGDEYFDMYIDGQLDYVALVNGEEEFPFIIDPQNAVVEIIESTDKEATARVYCGLKDGDGVIPISVECEFVKENSSWMLADSPLVDMLTSADGFEYTVGEAPSTGDRAFDTIAICLGGMAIALSVLCIVRRRREE